MLGLSIAAIPFCARAEPARSAFTMRGTVPTICRMDFDVPVARAAPDGVIDLGPYTEQCNRRDGYRVVVSHAAGMQAAIELDGIVMPLSTGDNTVLVDVSLPGYRTGVARIMLSTGSIPPGDLSFRVEPKGSVN